MVRQAPVICVMAPPVHLGAWSMALVLWLPFELLYYHRRKEGCVAATKSTTHLMKHLFSELNVQEYQVDILALSVTLLLYSLCKMEVLVAREELDETEIGKAFGVCEVTLLDWIKRRGVVGGKCFGYSTQNETKLLYGSTELKVFDECIFVITTQ